jgi:hypothetical protein
VVDKLPLDLDRTADINKKIEESVYDSEYWTVSIPNLPPSTSFPLQFAWVYEDGTVSDYSAYKIFTTPDPLSEEVANITTSWSEGVLKIAFDATSTRVTDYKAELTPTTGDTIVVAKMRNPNQVAQSILLTQEDQIAQYGNGNLKSQFNGLLRSKTPDGWSAGVPFLTAVNDDGISGTDIADSDWSVTATDNGYIVAWTLTAAQLSKKQYEYGEVWKSSTSNGTFTKRAIDKSPIAIQGVTATEYIKIRYLAKTGRTSNYSNVKSVTPYSPVTVDVVGPPNVNTPTTFGGLDPLGTIGFNGYANISWTAVTTGGIRGYRIQYRPITTPASSYAYVDSPGAGTSYRLTGLNAGVTYEIAVATYDEYNNTSTQYVSGANVTIGGTPYIASTVDVSGYFSAKANSTDADSTAFKFGYFDKALLGKRGISLTQHNYWYIDSNQGASLKVGGADNYITWNGASLVVTGDIQAKKGTFSGNINLASGASIYSGTITGNTSTDSSNTGGSLSGDGYILSSTGLIVRKTVNNIVNTVQLSTLDGSITANYGTIAGWTIDANSINKGNQVGFYAPDSPSATDVVIWSGGTRSSNKFNVTYGGKLTATEADINGKVTATSGFIGSGTSGWTISGNSIVSTGASDGIISGGQITGSAITGATVTAGIIQTSASSSERRIVIDGTSYKDTIFFKGMTSDATVNDGKIAVGFGYIDSYATPSPDGTTFSNAFPSLTISAPTVTTSGSFAYPAKIVMSNSSSGGIMELNATWTRVKGYLELLNGFDYGTQAVRMISAGTSAPTSSIGKEGSVYFQIG